MYNSNFQWGQVEGKLLVNRQFNSNQHLDHTNNSTNNHSNNPTATTNLKHLNRLGIIKTKVSSNRLRIQLASTHSHILSNSSLVSFHNNKTKYPNKILHRRPHCCRNKYHLQLSLATPSSFLKITYSNLRHNSSNQT